MAAGTSDQGVTRDYKSALYCFWEGRSQTAIEHLSKLLADDPEREDRFQLYRLWIEILSDQKEIGTLRSLCNHLHILSLMESDSADSYMALRGIASLEMDEPSAATLYAKGVRSHLDNPYCAELYYRLGSRLYDRVVKNKLAPGLNKLTDYFHIQSVCQDAHNRNDEATLAKAGKRIAKLYPEAPLYLEFKAHESIEARKFEEACNYTTLLADKFPTRVDFGVMDGFAKLKAGQLDGAIGRLERVAHLTGDKDIDVQSLLATAYTQKSDLQEDEEIYNKSVEHLNKTAELLGENGMSTLLHDYLRTRIKVENVNDLSVPKPWMVKVNEAKFHYLREMPASQITKMNLPVDENAKTGDLIFAVGDDYRSRMTGEESWRLASVYVATSEPVWDPIEGYLCEAKLVSRPEMSIPFAIELEGRDLGEGIIELDFDGLDLITDAIQEYGKVDSSSAKILESIHKVRASS